MSKDDKRQYLVTSTFVDKETGDVVLPGAYFFATEQRARRLQAAGVIADDDAGTTPDAADTEKKPVKTKTTKDDTPDVPDTPSTSDVAGGDTNADNPTEG
ncbi:hypothetical protein [Paenibacillus polymyxa]|jgi:hypothetical protein|uniref:hypothetical protein n=1 Tax=Paenibacillus polymyxa TaxID=1406 RepID=UPI00083E33D4|nr:hypothetical protein [Paenibacillus polymyxa]ODB61356.1 hypothetical protein A7309_15015 [Paenibacillus polymyxa]